MKTFINEYQQKSCLNFIQTCMGRTIEPEKFDTFDKQFDQVIDLFISTLGSEEVDRIKKIKSSNLSIEDKNDVVSFTIALMLRPITYETIEKEELDVSVIYLVRLLLYIRGYMVGLNSCFEKDIRKSISKFKKDIGWDHNVIKEPYNILVSDRLWKSLLSRKQVANNDNV